MRINDMAFDAARNSAAHGFHDDLRTCPPPQAMATRCMLLVTEVAELTEAYRRGMGQAPDSHCPELTAEEAEMADIAIRLGDMAATREIDLERAIRIKMAYNRSRPVKHGNKLF